MKQIILWCFMLSFYVSGNAHIQTNADSKGIRVEYNKNVELLGFVYFVGYEGKELENESDPAKREKHIKQYAYGYHLYQQYKKYENSEHVKSAINAALKYDLWLDYMINLLIQLDNFPNAALREDIVVNDYLKFSLTKDPVDARKNVTQFIEALNKLYIEVQFDAYLTQNIQKYDNALQQVKSRLPPKEFIPAMEKFYGKQFDAYTLVPSLTIPASMGFGVKYTRQGKTSIFNVFGAFDQQQFNDETNLDMGFGNEQQIIELSTHEFGHSFVNPVIAQIPDTFMTQTQTLFEPIKNDMTRQGYPQWKTSLNEHFVRAGEIMIARNMGNPKAAEALQKHYIESRKFIYLPEILTILEPYNHRKHISYQQAVGQAMEKLKSKVSN
ncbi:DUF4932 domain-containing protein [Rhodocytophaga rosea]|uniref:DUF4932 domain-containing protein n=1 Tax=Rhodocytophaga rosea TaxID=2704465 RepID=A0A6C0GQ41_9BACT|nr:DUF4932 domain-containing protein [Rhodocytophaga rosea]QHT70047.1 DUF4932 domain-containing protein [Rhodocytophaga rosea]